MKIRINNKEIAIKRILLKKIRQFTRKIAKVHMKEFLKRDISMPNILSDYKQKWVYFCIVNYIKGKKRKEYERVLQDIFFQEYEKLINIRGKEIIKKDIPEEIVEKNIPLVTEIKNIIEL